MLMKKLLLFTFTIILICFTSSYIFANDNDTDISYVEALIKSKTDKALSLINVKNLKESEKKDKIFEILGPLFDVRIMSKLVLGKHYWSQLTKEQKKKFMCLFKKRIKMVYLDRVSLYSDLKVTYQKPFKKGKRRIYIPATYIVKGKKYSVLFKLWKSKLGWKIYDAEVEGISIVKTYRSQFQDIIKKGSIDELFKKLEILTETASK